MKQNRLRAVTLAALFLTATVMTAAPAAADENSGIASFEVSTDSGLIAKGVGLVTGLGERAPDFGDWLRDVRDQEPTTEGQAQDLKTFLNNHSAEFVSHTNKVLDHYNATVYDTTYVLELTIENTEDDTTESSTIYVVAQADGENVTSTQVVNSTNKTVDANKTLSVFQAETLNEDVRSYYDEYVSTGKVPSESYIVKISSKYGEASEIKVLTS